MKVKIDNLTDAALDWAVAIAEGLKPEDIYISGRSLFRRLRDEDGNLDGRYMTGPDLLFSRKWEAGGPIIEREKIKVSPNISGRWSAQIRHEMEHPLVSHKVLAGWTNSSGPTPLVAAMRCYVASKLGAEVEVPDSLS